MREKFAKDASNGLSFEKMEYVTNKLHPRIVEKDLQSGVIKFKKYSFCKNRTGLHCICKKFRESDLVEYGEGIVLYFMFVKYLIFLFLIFSFLSIPAFYFYWSGNVSDLS